MFEGYGERQRAFGFGFDLNNLALPEGSITAGHRAYAHGSYYADAETVPSYIANHVEQAVELLIEQFKRRPRLVALLSSLVMPAQEIEDTLRDFLLHRRIATATGDTLDAVGENVGCPRSGRTVDAVYRQAIYMQIALNRSCGQADLLSHAATFFTDAKEIHLWENYTASVLLFIYALSIPAGLTARLKQAAAGGVALLVVRSENSRTFRFSSVRESSEYGKDDGYGGLGQSLGGMYAGIAP